MMAEVLAEIFPDQREALLQRGRHRSAGTASSSACITRQTSSPAKPSATPSPAPHWQIPRFELH